MSSRRSPTEAVQHAIAALAEGRVIVVVDDADREDESDLVVAGDFVTAEQMAFMVRYGTGIVCTPMPAERADELRLPPMVSENTDAHGTAFTVSVDHMSTGTGVSAADRAGTARALAAPGTLPGEPRRPGHVFPLRARKGGVLVRPGHTEAATDLTLMAGAPEVTGTASASPQFECTPTVDSWAPSTPATRSGSSSARDVPGSPPERQVCPPTAATAA